MIWIVTPRGAWIEGGWCRRNRTAREAALIGAAQRVEHYEIAAYGTARTHARLLGLSRAADDLLKDVAEDHVNRVLGFAALIGPASA